MSISKKSGEELESLVEKSKKVAKASTIEEEGIESSWCSNYEKIARWCKEGQEFIISMHTYY